MLMLHASNLHQPATIHKTVSVRLILLYYPSSGAMHLLPHKHMLSTHTPPSPSSYSMHATPMHTISSQLGGQTSGIIYALRVTLQNQMKAAISNSAHDDDHNNNRNQKTINTATANDHPGCRPHVQCRVYTSDGIKQRLKKM